MFKISQFYLITYFNFTLVSETDSHTNICPICWKGDECK